MVIGEYGRRWLVLATVASLGGCANPTSWVPAVSSNQGTASQPVMFVGPCVFPSGGPEAGFLAAAGGILAKEAIGAAVKSLGELIKEAGEEQHWKLEGTRLMTFAGRQPRHCIQFVVGRFFEDPALAQTTIAAAHWQLPYVTNEELKNLAVAGIWLADRPEVLIEFESVSGPEALGYQLTYISYDRPFRPVTPGYNPQAALAVEFALRQPGQAVGSNGAQVSQLSLGNIRPPFAFRYRPPTSYTLGSQSGPLQDGSNPQAGQPGSSPVQLPGMTGGVPPLGARPPVPPPGSTPVPPPGSTQPQAFTPVGWMLPKQIPWMKLKQEQGEPAALARTLQVTLVETDPGSKFLQNLGQAIAGTETQIEQLAGQELVPSERAAAEALALQTQKAAIDAFYKAWTDAAKAETACASARESNAANVTELCVAARGAQEAANLLADPAGVRKPYGAADLITP